MNKLHHRVARRMLYFILAVFTLTAVLLLDMGERADAGAGDRARPTEVQAFRPWDVHNVDYWGDRCRTRGIRERTTTCWVDNLRRHERVYVQWKHNFVGGRSRNIPAKCMHPSHPRSRRHAREHGHPNNPTVFCVAVDLR